MTVLRAQLVEFAPFYSPKTETNMHTQVRKRTGDIVEFHPEKIHDAVTEAMKAVGQYDSTNASNVTHEAAERAVRASDDGIIAVDDIHRLVENTLMDYRLHDIAREYIAYRDRHKPDIFRKRVSIEPVEYPHLESYVESINHSYWLHTEFQYEPDIQDMRINMEPEDREVVKRSMLAISQVENAVKKFWARMDEHIQKPEISDVGYTFADSEVRHKRAYRHLLRIMGLHDEFEKLNDVPAMRKRIEYLERVNAKVKAEDPFEYFEAIVLFSMFIENVSLFSQFLIIMSFRKHENVLKGISNAIEATSKEECFLPGTEIMTPRGWRQVEDVAVGDIVYQYNQGVWQTVQVTHTTTNDFDGEMVRFSARGRQCVVTPGHDMVYYNPSGELKKKTANDFVGDTKKFVPQTAVSEVVTGIEKLSAFERLLVAFQADGHVTYWTDASRTRHDRGGKGGYNSTIAVKKKRKAERLEWIFDQISTDYSLTVDDRGYYKYIFHQDEPWAAKTFDWVNLSEISSEWCSDFVAELSFWDGSVEENGADRKYIYATTDKSCADTAQLVGTLAGFRAHIGKRVDPRSENYSDLYKVSFTANRERVRSHSLQKERIEYTGPVHCVTVPSGVIMTRLDQQPFIVGNCLHGMFGFDLVKTIRKENPSWWTPELVAHIEDITRQAEQAEIEVVEWIYEQGDSEVIPKAVAIEYVRFRLNESLEAIGLNPIFDIDDDIIKETDWFEEEIILSKNNDFFDNQSVDYTKRARAVSAHDLF